VANGLSRLATDRGPAAHRRRSASRRPRPETVTYAGARASGFPSDRPSAAHFRRRTIARSSAGERYSLRHA